jgi:hypothetical protein
MKQGGVRHLIALFFYGLLWKGYFSGFFTHFVKSAADSGKFQSFYILMPQLFMNIFRTAALLPIPAYPRPGQS